MANQAIPEDFYTLLEGFPQSAEDLIEAWNEKDLPRLIIIANMMRDVAHIVGTIAVQEVGHVLMLVDDQ